MSSCCVPLCRSNGRNADCKAEGIRFHELPAKIPLRNEWMKIISRENWIPGDGAKVCSRHFTPEDYRQGLKHRLLVKDAIPTLFPEFPTYMQESRKKKKQRKSPKTRFNPDGNKELQNLPIIPVERATDGGSNHSPVTIPVYIEEQPLAPNPVYVDASTSTQDNTPCRGRPQSTPSQLKSTIRSLNSKIAVLKDRVRKLIDKNEEIRSKRSVSEEIEKIIFKIEDDAKNSNRYATFLLEVLHAYVKQRACWSKETLLFCSRWQRISPKGYHYCRRVLLNIPSRSTIQRFNAITREDTSDQISAQLTPQRISATT